MTTRRWPSSPALSLLPRASIDPSYYPSLDSALKDLKSCSRRLQSIFSAYRDELHILERLFYKGKNQHRSALFWKRAAEMKRYSERLDTSGFPDMFALLRSSFYGATSIQNSKQMRGSWTHVPNSTYVIYIAERLAACLTLVNKLRERLLAIYRSFKLAMQSGAFVQLILTLAAIAARMNALMPEFQDVLQLSWTTNHQILLILDPDQARRIKTTVDHADVHHENVPIVVGFDVNIGEDTGSSVARSTIAWPENMIDTPSHDKLIAKTNSTVVLDDTLRFGTVTDEFFQPLASSQGDVERTVVSKPPTEVDKVSKRSRKGEINITFPKKAKMKRNEIDDIFGF